MGIPKLLRNLINVSTADPDDARRRKILNILLLFLGLVAFVSLLVTIFVDLSGSEKMGMHELGGVAVAYYSTVGLILATGVIYLINRYGPGWLASSLLLLFLIVALAFLDEPEEVAGGRSLLMFAIPIMTGAVILPPFASFIVAALCSITVSVISIRLGWLPNPFAISTFFILALISYISSRLVEQALNDLRTLNRELDQRVANRTREVAEALSKNEAILQSIADGVLFFDKNDEVVMANPAVESLLNRPSSEIIGRDIHSLVIEKIEKDDREMVIQLIQEGGLETPSVKFDWGEKTFSMSIAPVQLNTGEEVGSVVVLRDFTREAEIDRMKSAFISIASHELRTPLNAILGYVDMLQEGMYGPLSERQEHIIRRVVANIGHLLSLVNNLLDQAQIESGTMRLNFAPYSARDVLEQVSSSMEVLAHSQGLDLTLHIDDDLPKTMTGDHRRLRQILTNLINNAIKFTDEGKVEVQAYRKDEDFWDIQVADTGKGISEEAQSYVFEPFRQADESLTREYSGAGLGLTIVKQLTIMMGGEIKLESEVNKGSTFTVTMPINGKDPNISGTVDEDQHQQVRDSRTGS